MSRIVLTLLLALGMLFSAGCMKDPVYADMEAFDRYGATALRDTVSKDIEKRLLAAKTNEERIAILDEWIAMMERNIAAIDGYKPQTPEFGGILVGIRGALANALEGARDMRSAMVTGNSMKMNDAAIKLTRGGSQMVEHMNALHRLAAEKGYELKE